MEETMDSIVKVDLTPKSIRVFLKKFQVKKLDYIAKKKDQSRSRLVRSVIEEFIEKEFSDEQEVLG
jgi:metal-responsive CopG/Arc/MetJ family transcriptional regulator